jgi:hypothetical protein
VLVPFKLEPPTDVVLNVVELILPVLSVIVLPAFNANAFVPVSIAPATSIVFVPLMVTVPVPDCVTPAILNGALLLN